MLTLREIEMRCTKDGDCWIWAQGVNGKGHPQAHINGKGGQMVRRYVWELHHGRKLPAKGWVVFAECRSDRCCCPEHLEAMPRGKRTHLAYVLGERVPAAEYRGRLSTCIKRGMAKLSMDVARQIRARMDEPNTRLAAEYGVHPKTIYSIKNGRSWRESARGASVFNWAPA